MELIDYEQRVLDKREELIDSYVEQYGEVSLRHIEDVFDRLRFYFRLTPGSIMKFIKTKISEELLEKSVSFLKEIGFDPRLIKINKNKGICSDDPNIDKKIQGLLGYNRVLEYCDLSLFGGSPLLYFNEGANSLSGQPIERSRAFVLKSLGYFPETMTEEDIMKQENFKPLCRSFREAAHIATRHIERVLAPYLPYLDLYQQFVKQEQEIKDKQRRRFAIFTKEFFCDEDQEVIEREESFDPDSLKDKSLFFDFLGELAEETPFFSFLPKYSEQLLRLDTEETKRLAIFSKRKTYLLAKGVPLSFFEDNQEKLLHSDWFQISELQPFLPPISKVEKSYHKFEFLKKAADLEIEEGRLIHPRNAIPSNRIAAFQDCSGGLCIYHITEDLQLVFLILIDPLNSSFEYIDVLIDHEIRHAIEMSCLQSGADFYYSRGGYQIYYQDFSDEKKANICFFRNLSELTTQRLSIESCRKRWTRGNYIVNMPHDITYSDANQYTYDAYLSNLAILYDAFPEGFLSMRRDPINTRMYSLLSFEEWVEVDQIIFTSSPETTARLQEFAEKIQSRKHLFPPFCEVASDEEISADIEFIKTKISEKKEAIR